MKSLSIGKYIFVTISILIVILIIQVFFRFRKEIRTLYNALDNSTSRVVNTECGSIEYVIVGEGYPVLVIHGIFGGFDQGLVTAKGKFGDQYSIIAPSRFGYLGTPLPDNPTVEDQADAFACLLDELNIEKTVVFATSAGGTSAIQFALRHPERISALILNSSNAPGEVEAGLPPKIVAKLAFQSDFIFWLLTTYFQSSMNSMMGVPEGFNLTPEYESDIARVMKTILPVKPRADGALFDMYISNAEINTGYPVEDIMIPTLIINAKDDPLTLYENAEALAERIPGAKLVSIPSGGHMTLGNEQLIRSEIDAFLTEVLGSPKE